MAKRKTARMGRERATEAILDAAEALFSEHGYSAVSVRDIAARAGVSHALVHRYLGSKREVYRTTLQRHETVIRDAAPSEADLLEATRSMLQEAVLRQRPYVRLIAHSALHGLSYKHTSGRFAATERLVELAQEVAAAEGESHDRDLDPRFVIASLVALLIGWSAAREWVLQASGLGDMSEQEFLDSFERFALDALRSRFPSLDAGDTG